MKQIDSYRCYFQAAGPNPTIMG